jgi:hypothetical protein
VLLGIVALAVGWLQWPRPPVLDGERWFKVSLCTLLRGRIEAAGGDVEAWEREVVRLVPYHPAGRMPERKVSNPVAAQIPGLALPGEQALVEALARRPDAAARWAWLYDEDPAGLDARFDDPTALGAACDWTALFGPGASWDSLAAWGRPGEGDRVFLDALRRSVPARWVLVEGRSRSGVLAAVAAELADAAVVPWGEDDLGPALRALAGEREDRLVLVAEEAGVARLLRALVGAADLRDHVLAVVSVGGVVGGRTDEEGPYGEAACRDWLAAHFTQSGLDTDVVRLTPYLALQWLDRAVWPPGIPGLPLQSSRFPEPSGEGATATTLEVVDLGPLPTDAPPELVARALVAVTSGWIATRR